MVQIIPANIERLKGLGMEVLWKEDRFCACPAQTALWIRDAFAALWHQFSLNEAGEILGKNGIGLPAIWRYLERRFPSFYDTALSGTTDEFQDSDLETGPSERRIFSLLCALGDFSHIGHGRYIPRETRLIHTAPEWARIAGTLNMQVGELPDENAKIMVAGTLGRVFPIADGVDTWPRDERSPLMTSKDRLRTLDEWIEPLLSAVTEKPAFDLAEAKFYTVKQTGRRSFVAWEESPNHAGLCLCRFNRSNYMLANISNDHCTSSAYCEVNGDQRKFLEHYFRRIWGVGTSAILKRVDGNCELQLKFSLPKLFETELLAASATFHPDPEGVWIKTFSFSEAVSPFVIALLNLLGIKTLP
jgi:hypothetical protein